MALLAAACSGDNGPSGNQPTSIAISAGNTQAVRYGTPVAIAPSVVVTNAARADGGSDGHLHCHGRRRHGQGGTTTTNAQGIATVGSWTLGPAPGVNTLRATAGNISVNIDATAVTGPPSTISVVAGNNQTWVQGSLLPVAPSVVVTDGQFPVPGAQVVFAVDLGRRQRVRRGADHGHQRHCDGRRMAHRHRRRQTPPRATVQSSSIAAVTFTATAEPLVITAVNKVDGDNQSGFAGNFADKKVTVSVLNQFGGATEGVPVTFSVAGGGGTICVHCRRPPASTARRRCPGGASVRLDSSSSLPPPVAATPVTFTADRDTRCRSRTTRSTSAIPSCPGCPSQAPAAKAVFTRQ